MPRLMDKLRGVQESAGGFADIEPGAYKLRITKVEPMERQEYARVYWDVADGPHKGAYAKSGFPPSDVISWKESAYGMLKGKLHRLSQCNPGRFHEIADADGRFVTLQEFEDDNWRAFEGAYFAAVVRRRLYTAGPRSKTPGADRAAIEVARWLTPDEFRAQDWPQSLLEDNDQRERDVAQASVEHSMPTPPAQSAIAVYDEDVPF